VTRTDYCSNGKTLRAPRSTIRVAHSIQLIGVQYLSAGYQPNRLILAEPSYTLQAKRCRIALLSPMASTPRLRNGGQQQAAPAKSTEAEPAQPSQTVAREPAGTVAQSTQPTRGACRNTIYVPCPHCHLSRKVRRHLRWGLYGREQ
jgi:hypothetical protein